MGRIVWKEGLVFSMQTRKGVFVLAQMLRKPFIRFYRAFSSSPLEWNIDSLTEVEVLFSVAVIPKFLFPQSKVFRVKNIKPNMSNIDSDLWLHPHSGFREVLVYKGLPNETKLTIYGNKPGGLLLRKNLWWSPSIEKPIREGYAGICDELIEADVLSSTYCSDIDKYELTGLNLFPTLNDRLSLSYILQKPIDPLRDLIFNRTISPEYEVTIRWMSLGNNSASKKQLLDEYFR